MDAAHALWLYGVDKYKRRRKAKASDQDKKRMEWAAYEKETADAFWDDMFKPDSVYEGESDKHIWPYPEENLLYFVQKNAPHMPEWKRELLRIVRKTAQYFYPQIQTKLMNEGWASFWHYTLMGDLYEGGHINEGSYLEFLDSHTAITNQYGIKDGVQAAMNPYALGFRMFQDIKRACENPTEEDYRTMPLCAGQPWLATMTEIMENFKDENFVLEFLSPKVIKDLKMCCIEDDADKDYVKFLHIQDGDDYRKIRKYLAKQYSYDNMLPSVEVVGFAERGDRTLYLRHTEVEGRTLERETEKATTKYLHKLWGYPIELQKTDGAGTELIRTRRNY